jgi:zinc protease
VNRMRFSLLVLAFALSCASGPPLPKPGEIGMKPFTFRMRDFKAPSGLRIIVQEDHSAPVAGVVTVVGAGSSSDPTGKEGVAHFLEHMAFRMKPFADNPATMWELLPRSGVAEFNAYTGLDNTTYYEFGPKEMLPKILRLEGARMMDPERGIDEKVVDTEREVVRNELRERGETAFTSSIFGWMQQALFPEGHPYHRPGIGTHESLSNIKLADIQKFAKLHYRLDNMTMFIIGDVDLPAIDKLLTGTVPWLYGDPKNPTKLVASRLSASPPPPAESPKHDGMYTYEGPVQAPEIWIGWTLPAGFGPDSVLYEFVGNLVDGSLTEAVAEDRDIVSVGAFTSPGVKATMLICRVLLRGGAHPERSAEHVLNQLYKTWEPSTDATSDKIAAGRFTQARVVAATGMALQSEDIAVRAIAAAENVHFNGDPQFYSHMIKALSELDLEQVQQYAYRYLKRDRARMLYIKPLPPNARAKGSPTGLGGGYDDAAEARVPDYSPAEVRQLVKPPGFAALTTTTLKNGLELVVAPHPAIPSVTVQLGLHGGHASAERGLVRLAEFVARPWSKRHHTFFDFGAQASRGASQDQWEEQVRAGSGNLGNVLAILNDQLGSMNVASGMIDEFKKYVFPFLKKEEERPESKADREFWKALFGDHPYGRRSTIDELEKYDGAQVEGWIQRAFTPRNGVMAVVGDVEPAAAVRAADEWLGDWKAKGDALAAPKAPEVAPRPLQILVTHRAAATQGELRLGCLLPSADPKRAVLYRLMTMMVSDHLFKAVRGKLGASYGIHPGLGILRGGAAYMTASGNINNGSLAAALKVIKQYWDGLPNGDFTDKEMNRVRYELALGFNMQLTTSEAIANEIVRVRNLGWPLASVDEYGEHLASLTRDDAKAAFKSCHEQAVLSLVGDQEVIGKALRESGWK